MNEDKTEPLGNAGELDPLAMETARELSPELLARAVAMLNVDAEESEKEQNMNELLEEINLRANDIYNRKKGSDLN